MTPELQDMIDEQHLVEVLVDGSCGLYAGQQFAEAYSDCLVPADQSIVDALLQGPDGGEDYWDACTDLYDTMVDIGKGRPWAVLWRDGDIVAVDYQTIDQLAEENRIDSSYIYEHLLG